MTELIDVRLAVNQEIRTRKHFALILMLAMVSLIIVSGAVLFELHIPLTVLGIILLMFFYVQNQKEVKRLEEKYGL